MKSKFVKAAAAAATLSLGLVVPAGRASADDRPAWEADPVTSEKCYGVAKAGQNDCESKYNGHECAGWTGSNGCRRAIDGDANEFILVPTGLCERLAKGKLQPRDP